jgi:hypothetical protein
MRREIFMPCQNAISPMSARRFLIIVFCLLILGAATHWVVDWVRPRPLPTSGGVFSPVRFEISGPHFLQGDARWASDLLAETPETLGDAGCAVASAAMVLGGYGIPLDPGRLNSFLRGVPGGYTPEGWIYWEKAAEIAPELTPALLPHYEDLPSFFLIDWNLMRGNPVIARVRYPSGITHFVVVCGKDGSEYLVRDPGKGGERGLTRLSDFPAPVEALRFYRKPGVGREF